jgi:hypothetical protein
MSILRKTIFGRKISAGGDVATDFITVANITDQREKDAVNYLMQALIDNGLWDLMRAVYPLVGSNANSHSINLIDTSLYTLTWDYPVYSAIHDYNGSRGRGHTGILNNDLPQNDCHLSAYVMDDQPGGNWIEIGTSTSSNFHLAVDWGSNGNLSRLNVAYKGFSYNPATTWGMGIVSRTAVNVSTLWDKGYKLATDTRNSVSYSNQEIAVGGGQYSTQRQLGLATIGLGLTDEQCTTLTNIADQYQTILERKPF